MKTSIFAAASLAAALALTACDKDKDAKKPEAPPPSVTVVAAEKGFISPVDDFVGQAKAQDCVVLSARVNGMLMKRNFSEGQPVKAGDKLFEIEKDVYQAELEQAQGSLLAEQASQKSADIELARTERLLKADATSRKDYDSALCRKMSADAKVAQADASVKKAQINLSYTDISSPFDGRVGLSTYSVGNIVGPESKQLATVVKLDPIRVEFNLDEKSLLEWSLSVINIDEAQRLKLRKSFLVRLKLQDGSLYKHEGELSYSDNHVNSSTGTLLVQATFPNPDMVISPGMYLRVLVSKRYADEAILIPGRAVLQNQLGSYVFIVSKDGKVSSRPLKTGAPCGQMIQAVSGVEPGEQVVVEGIQKIRQGMAVNVVQDKPDLSSLQGSSAPEKAR